MAVETAGPATGTGETSPAGGAVGCLWAALGAITAPLVWAPHAALSIDGGFEDEARDLSVLVVDLPLIVVSGALIPLATWALTSRWTHRPWVAALAALAALALTLWVLAEWWAPLRQPATGEGQDI